MITRLSAYVFAASVLAAGSVARSQDVSVEPTSSPAPRLGEPPAGEHPLSYQGLVPGGAVTPSLSRRFGHDLARWGRVVTWPGFQTTATGSRVFVATTATPSVSWSRTPGRYVFTLHATHVPLQNNRRPLEVEAFDTPIRRAYVRNQGSDAQLVIEMRRDADAMVTVQTVAPGLTYLYVEFAARPLAPAAERASERRPVPSVDAVSRAPTTVATPRALDDERAPPVQLDADLRAAARMQAASRRIHRGRWLMIGGAILSTVAYGAVAGGGLVLTVAGGTSFTEQIADMVPLVGPYVAAGDIAQRPCRANDCSGRWASAIYVVDGLSQTAGAVMFALGLWEVMRAGRVQRPGALGLRDDGAPRRSRTFGWTVVPVAPNALAGLSFAAAYE